MTHWAWQLTSPAAQAARQVEVGSVAELVPEALLVVSLWAAARPRRATKGMKACMLIDKSGLLETTVMKCGD